MSTRDTHYYIKMIISYRYWSDTAREVHHPTLQLTVFLVCVCVYVLICPDNLRAIFQPVDEAELQEAERRAQAEQLEMQRQLTRTRSQERWIGRAPV